MTQNQKKNLDVQTIIDTKFNIDYKGYNTGEVDKFMELIIDKIREDQTIIEYLQHENTALTAKVTELKARNQTEIGKRISINT